MERTLEPELLDSLPPHHPDALHNRRDLRLTNIVMRNHAWIERTVARHVRPGERVLEVGAGTGELAQRLGQRGIAVDALDLWPAPEDWPRESTWHRTDIRTFDEWSRYRVVFGNLIFHQFSETELRSIGARFGGVRVVIACEPARHRLSQILYATIAPWLGANRVTLHDAHVSIAAGFLQDELPNSLGLDQNAWDLRCTTAPIGAYHMVAVRRS